MHLLIKKNLLSLALHFVIVIGYFIIIQVETIILQTFWTNFSAIILIHSKFLKQAVFCILQNTKLRKCPPIAGHYYLDSTHAQYSDIITLPS